MTWNEHDEDYQTFLKSDSSDSSLSLKDDSVLSYVRNDLKILPWRSITKLMCVHILSAFMSVMICPQFGLSFFKSMGLMHYFMSLGPLGCFAACGMFFMVMSLLGAYLILKADELAYIKQRPFLLSLALTVCSLAFFWMAGPLFVFEWTLLIWAIGALIVSWPGLKSLYTLKVREVDPSLN